MAEDVRITSMPDNSGSSARVGYDLWNTLRHSLPSGKSGVDRIQQELDLYTQCRRGAAGSSYDTSGLKV
jgi:hypothetical protein